MCGPVSWKDEGGAEIALQFRAAATWPVAERGDCRALFLSMNGSGNAVGIAASDCILLGVGDSLGGLDTAQHGLAINIVSIPHSESDYAPFSTTFQMSGGGVRRR